MSGRSGNAGSFTVINKTQTIDFPSVAANTAADAAIAVTRTLPGDVVLCAPMGTWDAGLSLPLGRCLVAGTVQFRVQNSTAGALDPASQECRLKIVR